MKTEPVTIEIKKRIAATKYTFDLDRHQGGTHVISGRNFSSPDSDGIEVRNIIQSLKIGQRVTVTITIAEE